MINLYTQLAILAGSIGFSLICHLLWVYLDARNLLTLKISSILLAGHLSSLISMLNIGYITYGYITDTLLL